MFFGESERSELTDSPRMNLEDESRIWRVGELLAGLEFAGMIVLLGSCFWSGEVD